MDPPSGPPRSGPGPRVGPGTPSVAIDDVATKPAVPIVAADAAVTATHIARFEFGDHGTKVLMVEWYPGAAALPTPDDDLDLVSLPDAKLSSFTTRSPPSSSSLSPTTSPREQQQPPHNNRAAAAAAAGGDKEWNVSWPGKSTFLPARDADDDGTRRRVYFMLPSDVPVPGTVTVSRRGHQTLVLKTLPAIFPERFEAEHGQRGVLHRLWAKKRLAELDREVESELRTNPESVGLEMALAERRWIVDNFLPSPQAPAPLPPRSPVPGRLGDKLKGLRLATGPVGLAQSSIANTFTGLDNTLSPLGGDIAVSSFAAISRSNVAPAAAVAPMSLDAVLEDDGPIVRPIESQKELDDLFALPMSPRSPDMIRSPFSVLGPRPF